jgi:hypothetical protein
MIVESELAWMDCGESVHEVSCDLLYVRDVGNFANNLPPKR